MTDFILTFLLGWIAHHAYHFDHAPVLSGSAFVALLVFRITQFDERF